MSREVIWFDIDAFSGALESALDGTQREVKAAIRSTMARTRRHATTLISSMIREKWNIKKKDLDKRIAVKVGSRGTEYDSFEMVIKGTSVSLAYFGATQYAGNRVQTRRVGRIRKTRSAFQGVQVEVLKGRKTKLAGAFMQAADSGHTMVMKRKGKGRYPLAIKASISPASMFEDAGTADKFEEAIFDFIEREFDRQLAWRLERL